MRHGLAGGGDDHVVAAADAANDCYDGGSGQDRLDYSTATFSVTVDVGRGTADGLDIGHDLIAAFEEVITGSGDDHIVAGSTSVSMTGGDGNDTFEFQRSGGRSADDDGPQDHRLHGRRPDRGCDLRDQLTSQEDGARRGQLSDMFDDIYLSADGDNRPVRFRFEEVDSNKLTFVDVHDRPDTDDFYTIEVVRASSSSVHRRRCLRQSRKSGHETLRSERVRPGRIAIRCRSPHGTVLPAVAEGAGWSGPRGSVGDRLRRMGGDREAGRRCRRRRYGESRPEPEGGPASGRRHRENACDPAGRSRQGRPGSGDAGRRPDQGGAPYRAVAAGRGHGPPGATDRRTRQPSPRSNSRPSSDGSRAPRTS